MRNYRNLILLICVACMPATWMPAQAQAQTQPLTVTRQGEFLRVASPQLHFLDGKPLERLRNGASVTYAISLALGADQEAKPIYRLRERFIISFDLWEEKFSVVQLRTVGRTGSRLIADLAEAWCLEMMAVPVQVVPAGKAFVIKLECSLEANAAETSGDPQPGLNLGGLIDIFSRKGHPPPPHWVAVSGPLRLSDLKDQQQGAPTNPVKR